MVFQKYLAPIHDFTNLPYRLLAKRYGAQSACIPLINSIALANVRRRGAGGKKWVDSRILSHLDEKSVGVQIVGSSPELIGKACKAILDLIPWVGWLNLNCGCPSEKTMSDGGGSAMLDAPGSITKAVSAMRKASDKPISVKLRLKGGHQNTLSICKKIESAGADFIIIHGRTPEQGYSGKADWDAIRRLKESVGIPVIGNGDIATASEGMALIRDGFCDGFMVGRAAMKNPMLFSDKAPEGVAGRFRLLREYISLHEKHLGAPELADIKVKASNFMTAVPDGARIRDRICRSVSVEEIVGLEDELGYRLTSLD